MTVAPSTVSFMRLSERRNVLLPHPLGPMSASTRLRLDVEGDVVHGHVPVVADAHVLRAHLDARFFDAGRRRRNNGHHEGNLAAFVRADCEVYVSSWWPTRRRGKRGFIAWGVRSAAYPYESDACVTSCRMSGDE